MFPGTISNLQKFTFGIYSPESIKITEIKEPEYLNLPDKELLLTGATTILAKEDKFATWKESETMSGIFTKFRKTQSGYTYYLVENRSSNPLGISVRQTGPLRNLEIRNSYLIHSPKRSSKSRKSNNTTEHNS